MMRESTASASKRRVRRGDFRHRPTDFGGEISTARFSGWAKRGDLARYWKFCRSIIERLVEGFGVPASGPDDQRCREAAKGSAGVGIWHAADQ